MADRAAALALGLTTLVLVLLPETARPGGAITVHHMERPPSYVTENGRAAGLLNVLAAEVLGSADIPHRFEVLPPKRILEEIAVPGAAACSVGWIKTPERETIARLGLPKGY